MILQMTTDHCLNSINFLCRMTKPKRESFFHSTLLTLIDCFIRSFYYGFALETWTFFVFTVGSTSRFIIIGAFQLKVIFCGTLATEFLICAIGSRQENSFKLLRVEMENYHINMKMGMYWIEPPWVSIYLTKAYETKYRCLYS